jgi:hypothetical protein
MEEVTTPAAAEAVPGEAAPAETAAKKPEGDA